MSDNKSESLETIVANFLRKHPNFLKNNPEALESQQLLHNSGIASSLIETHKLFPARTNVEFIQVLSTDHLRMRVWERGAGVTLACGSGACAAAAAAVRRRLAGPRMAIDLDGGTLWLDASDTDHIMMTGPTALAFCGTWPDGGQPTEQLST